MSLRNPLAETPLDTAAAGIPTHAPGAGVSAASSLSVSRRHHIVRTLQYDESSHIPFFAIDVSTLGLKEGGHINVKDSIRRATEKCKNMRKNIREFDDINGSFIVFSLCKNIIQGKVLVTLINGSHGGPTQWNSFSLDVKKQQELLKYLRTLPNFNYSADPIDKEITSAIALHIRNNGPFISLSRSLRGQKGAKKLQRTVGIRPEIRERKEAKTSSSSSEVMLAALAEAKVEASVSSYESSPTIPEARIALSSLSAVEEDEQKSADLLLWQSSSASSSSSSSMSRYHPFFISPKSKPADIDERSRNLIQVFLSYERIEMDASLVNFLNTMPSSFTKIYIITHSPSSVVERNLTNLGLTSEVSRQIEIRENPRKDSIAEHIGLLRVIDREMDEKIDKGKVLISIIGDLSDTFREAMKKDLLRIDPSRQVIDAPIVRNLESCKIDWDALVGPLGVDSGWRFRR